MPEQWPTKSSSPSLSYSPRSSVEIRPSAFSLYRNPTITQSAVLYFLTLATASRDPGRYGESSLFATTPSSPAASIRSSQRSASSGSRVYGESWNRFALRSSSLRRFSSGSLCSFSPFQSRMSKTMNCAGISADSLRIRLSAGWSRSCIESKSSLPFFEITISPSSAEWGGSSLPSGSSSGK